MPTSLSPSMTGSRRTLCSPIVRIASSTESSAPIVTASAPINRRASSYLVTCRCQAPRQRGLDRSPPPAGGPRCHKLALHQLSIGPAVRRRQQPSIALFFGLGAVILYIAAVALGRLSVRGVSDVRAAERRHVRRGRVAPVADHGYADPATAAPVGVPADQDAPAGPPMTGRYQAR